MGKSKILIPFGGLAIGEHEFEFEINNTFFELFNENEALQGNVTLKVVLLKQNSLLQLFISFNGNIKTECDRCLVNSDFPISGKERLVIKHGDTSETNEDILVLRMGLEEADITQYVYEYIATAIPLKKIPCEAVKPFNNTICDQVLLQKLNHFSNN